MNLVKAEVPGHKEVVAPAASVVRRPTELAVPGWNQSDLPST